MAEVDVQTDRGFSLPMIPAASERPHTFRAYIEAVRGERYGIRVTNRSPVRVGVVIAVDGRNIISGEKSYLTARERMYLLDPYASGLYEGWRTSRDQVNRFYFTTAADSYAGAWGDRSALGVIAVAVFPERRPPDPVPLYDPEGVRRHQDEKGGLPSGGSPPLQPRAQAQPGTGFGEGRYAPSVRVAFDPEPRPAEEHYLKYEWRETLCRKGIIDCRAAGNRFWHEQRGYAPHPPPGIRR